MPRKQFFKIIAMLILLLTTALPAAAMNLPEAMAALTGAKQQGLLGEQPDGYLGVVNNEGNAAAIARLINEARRAEYQRMAKENKLNIKDVEALAGQKAIERTPPGHYILSPGGWQKK